jgi:hypothetical protein
MKYYEVEVAENGTSRFRKTGVFDFPEAPEKHILLTHESSRGIQKNAKMRSI